MNNRHKALKNYLPLIAAEGFLLAVASAHAISLDLATAGAGGSVNGGFFRLVPNQSAGMSVIDPFVRIQQNNSGEGCNTGLTAMPDVKAGKWTREILLSAIPIVVNPAGAVTGSHYQFLLVVNQTAKDTHELLSLNKTVSAFAGCDNARNPNLYPMFGDPNWSNDGPEEWAVLKAATPPPSRPDGGGTIILFGAGLLALGASRGFPKV